VDLYSTQHFKKTSNEAETVSVFNFSFISPCATGFTRRRELCAFLLLPCLSGKEFMSVNRTTTDDTKEEINLN